MSISRKVKEIAPSLTLEITAKAKKMKAEGVSVIGFGAGEPDFNTPEFIIDSAKKALDIGFTKYTPAAGMVELKKAVCDKFLKDNNLVYDQNQIVISSGAKSSLYHAICAVVDEGDEVVLPSPFWLTYPELIKLAGGKCVYVETKKENGYKMTAEQFASVINEKTKCLILNTPNNPTGAVYSEEEIKAIAKIAEENNIYVISDEIYEKLVYGGEKELTIIINGMSKTYAMTGWRIGYLAAPLNVAKAISSMQSHTTSNACSISQYASVTALTDPEGEKFIEKMQKVFDERRCFMIDMLKDVDGIECIQPKGAFYAFPSIQSTGLGSEEFCEALLKDQKVAVVPGNAFGESGEGFVRISYAYSIDAISNALEKIEKFVSKHR